MFRGPLHLSLLHGVNLLFFVRPHCHFSGVCFFADSDGPILKSVENILLKKKKHAQPL